LEDPITTKRETAFVCATGVCGACGIAFLIRVGNTITTPMPGTIQSASVGGGIAVGGTVVAVFASLSHTITTVVSAARATILVDCVAVVTLFSIVNNSVTAARENAIHAASIGDGVVVGGSVVALFTTQSINNAVSTKVFSAVQTASIGARIAVSVKGSL